MPFLFEFGEGILRTHLTWDDLQKEAIDIWGDSAVFGPNKGVKNIGDTRGFASKMCLIDPDWEDRVEAPKQFVVKICCQLAMTEAKEKMRAKSKELEATLDDAGRKMQENVSDGVRKGHNSEVNVYHLIQKYNINIPAPKVYKAVKFSDECNYKGYMIMEFVEGALSLNIFDNIGVEDVKQALRGIAALEAASLNFSDEEKDSLSYLKFKDLYQGMTNPGMMAAMMKVMRQYSKEELIPKIEKMEKILPEFVNISLFNMGSELGMTPVLVHSDAWSTNLLWTKPDGHNLKLSAIVDYQTAHFGAPAADILRLLGATLSGKDRQENWEKLTEYFYEQLLRELNGSPAPYSLEQLKENCRRFYPMAGALLVPMMGPICQMNQQNADEETKKQVLETINEKMECFMDDIFFYHERNQQLKEKHNA